MMMSGDRRFQENRLWFLSGLCDTRNYGLMGSGAMVVSSWQTKSYGPGLVAVKNPDNAQWFSVVAKTS